MERSGDVAGGDVMGLAHGIEVMVQWAVRQHVVLAEVEHPVLGSLDGAEGGVAGDAVAKGLAAGSILLVGVGETNISPALHVI